MTTTTKTEADAIASLATASIAPTYRQAPDSILPFLTLKDGSTKSLEYLLARPLRKRAAAVFSEPGSFIDYVQHHGTAGTLLLGECTETTGAFAAILDYHQPETADGLATPASIAGWGEHRAELRLVPTPEWVRWTGANGRPFSQAEFAEFLEDNAVDVIEPSGADLLEVALTLAATRSVNFRSGIRLKDGRHQLQYMEEIDARAGSTGQLEVPEAFTLGLVPFVGTDEVQIKARLRYRIDGGKLAFSFRLFQLQAVVEAVWGAVREQIEEETGRMVHRGTAAVQAPRL